MYLEHFKLKELPFRLSPDPAFLYPSQIHSRAKAYMESTIWFTDGFVVITGEIGAGKTTLIETFLKEIDQDVVVAQVNQTQVSPSGRPRIARRWFSNCEVTAPSMVQCPELCTRGAISLATSRPRCTKNSIVSTPA